MTVEYGPNWGQQDKAGWGSQYEYTQDDFKKESEDEEE